MLRSVVCDGASQAANRGEILHCVQNDMMLSPWAIANGPGPGRTRFFTAFRMTQFRVVSYVISGAKATCRAYQETKRLMSPWGASCATKGLRPRATARFFASLRMTQVHWKKGIYRWERRGRRVLKYS